MHSDCFLCSNTPSYNLSITAGLFQSRISEFTLKNWSWHGLRLIKGNVTLSLHMPWRHNGEWRYSSIHS